VQERLAALGFLSSVVEPGVYGPVVAEAVRDFQAKRGLRVDGVCGRETWASLVEAGYRLGSRHLFLRRPMLRGDDVADLQRRLGGMGFDAGRVDGIFGPNTEAALREFQRNTGLTVDGVCGPATYQAMVRLTGRERFATTVVASVREEDRLRRGPRTLAGRRVVIAEPGGLHALATAVAGAVTRAGASVQVLQHPDPSEQAAAANSAAAEVFVGLTLDPDRDGCLAAYYGRPDYESAAGHRLAIQIQEVLGGVLGAGSSGGGGSGGAGGVVALTLPALRETRMPAVVCELGPPPRVVERTADVAEGVAVALSRWAAAPCDNA
jgi:N-acetylmuramoyl-L-alanine amidase